MDDVVTEIADFVDVCYSTFPAARTLHDKNMTHSIPRKVLRWKKR